MDEAAEEVGQVLDVGRARVGAADLAEGGDVDLRRAALAVVDRDALMRGAAPKTDETTIAWALELAEPPTSGVTTPRVSRDVGGLNMPLVRIGTTNVYALVQTLSSGTAFT